MEIKNPKEASSAQSGQSPSASPGVSSRPISRRSTFGRREVLIVVGVVLINVIGFGLWIFFNRDGNVPLIDGISPKSNTAKVGDVFEARIPNAPKDKKIPVTITVKKIVRLVPEKNQSSVSLKFCNEQGCYSPQPVAVDPAEALIALDLDFNNPSTALAATSVDLPYMSSENFRFKVNSRYDPVKSMYESYPDNHWAEHEPTIYVYPSKRLTMTFFVRVPAETENVEFLYGSDAKDPFVRIPLAFERKENVPVLDTKNDATSTVSNTPVAETSVEDDQDLIKALMGTTIYSPVFDSYRTLIDKGGPFTCTFTATDKQDNTLVFNQEVSLDGEQYSYKTEIHQGSIFASMYEVFDGKRTVYYQTGSNPSNGVGFYSQVTDVYDSSCFKISGKYPSLVNVRLKGPIENVSCQAGASKVSIPEYDESMVKSVGKGC